MTPNLSPCAAAHWSKLHTVWLEAPVNCLDDPTWVQKVVRKLRSETVHAMSLGTVADCLGCVHQKKDVACPNVQPLRNGKDDVGQREMQVGVGMRICHWGVRISHWGMGKRQLGMHLKCFFERLLNHWL